MALPKRWEPYSAIGQQIEGTRFISFKVPLSEHLNQKVAEELRFSPDQLVKMVSDRGQSLGLVIDLTNTTRYYNKQEVIKFGIKYEKIFTEGKRVPSKAIVDQFFAAVDNFLAEDSEKDVLIGVHCTHGVNRTGYLVCRYMVEKMSIPPDTAIKAFIDARGHPIERDIYIKDLKLRENGGNGLPEEEAMGGDWKEQTSNPRKRSYHGDRPLRNDQRFPRRDDFSHPFGFQHRHSFPPRRPFPRRNFPYRRNDPPNHRQLQDGYRQYDYQSFDRQPSYHGYQSFDGQNGFDYPGFNEGYYDFDENGSYGSGYRSFDGYVDRSYVQDYDKSSREHRPSYHEQNGNQRGRYHDRRH